MLVEEMARLGLSYTSGFIGFVSSLIIIWGVLVAVKEFLIVEFMMNSHSDKAQCRRREIKQRLGGHLLLGLEVLIAADVIETIANPSLQEMAKLGSIVVIRTFISYFLEKELKETG